MIIRKYRGVGPNGRGLIESYSDKGFYIKKVNEDFLYTKAVDVIPLKYRYVETDIAITSNETEVEPTTEE